MDCELGGTRLEPSARSQAGLDPVLLSIGSARTGACARAGGRAHVRACARMLRSCWVIRWYLRPFGQRLRWPGLRSLCFGLIMRQRTGMLTLRLAAPGGRGFLSPMGLRSFSGSLFFGCFSTTGRACLARRRGRPRRSPDRFFWEGFLLGALGSPTVPRSTPFTPRYRHRTGSS